MLKKFIKKILDFFGYEIVSKSLLLKRQKVVSNAIKIISSIYVNKNKNAIVGIIFSRDRALQLHALLKSYFLNASSPARLIVFYSTSTRNHSSAYLTIKQIVRREGLNVDFLDHKGNFKYKLVSMLAKINENKIFFLCDDDLFINPINFRHLNSLMTSKYIFSMRHSPNLKVSYTGNSRMDPPPFTSYNMNAGFKKFKWSVASNEWSDPWSLNGHILSTSEVLAIASVSFFEAPNSFENALKEFNALTSDRVGLCCNSSIILNLPFNQVQTETPVRSGSFTAKYFLQKWNQGYTLNIDYFQKMKPQATNEEHYPTFLFDSQKFLQKIKK